MHRHKIYNLCAAQTASLMEQRRGKQTRNPKYGCHGNIERAIDQYHETAK